MGKPKAPDSYIDCRRPPILEAVALEGSHMTFGEAVKSLERKGYFYASPRPWHLGYQDRGMGRGDYVVLDRFGDLVAEVPSRANAELIISAVGVGSTVDTLESEKVRGLMQVIDRIIGRHHSGAHRLDEETFKMYEIAKRIYGARDNEEIQLAVSRY